MTVVGHDISALATLKGIPVNEGFIVSFLPKILGRNQDFTRGPVWGGELCFKNAWGEIGFG